MARRSRGLSKAPESERGVASKGPECVFDRDLKRGREGHFRERRSTDLFAPHEESEWPAPPRGVATISASIESATSSD